MFSGRQFIIRYCFLVGSVFKVVFSGRQNLRITSTILAAHPVSLSNHRTSFTVRWSIWAPDLASKTTVSWLPRNTQLALFSLLIFMTYLMMPRWVLWAIFYLQHTSLNISFDSVSRDVRSNIELRAPECIPAYRSICLAYQAESWWLLVQVRVLGRAQGSPLVPLFTSCMCRGSHVGALYIPQRLPHDSLERDEQNRIQI